MINIKIKNDTLFTIEKGVESIDYPRNFYAQKVDGTSFEIVNFESKKRFLVSIWDLSKILIEGNSYTDIAEAVSLLNSIVYNSASGGSGSNQNLQSVLVQGNNSDLDIRLGGYQVNASFVSYMTTLFGMFNRNTMNSNGFVLQDNTSKTNLLRESGFEEEVTLYLPYENGTLATKEGSTLQSVLNAGASADYSGDHEISNRLPTPLEPSINVSVQNNTSGNNEYLVLSGGAGGFITQVSEYNPEATHYGDRTLGIQDHIRLTNAKYYLPDDIDSSKGDLRIENNGVFIKAQDFENPSSTDINVQTDGLDLISTDVAGTSNLNVNSGSISLSNTKEGDTNILTIDSLFTKSEKPIQIKDSEAAGYGEINFGDNTFIVKGNDGLNSLFAGQGAIGVFNSGNFTATIYSNNIDGTNKEFDLPNKTGTIPVIGLSAPASSTDSGVVGEIRITSTFVYFCIGPNQWRRAALSSW